MNGDLTPREKLWTHFLAADPPDDIAFSQALNEYRDALILAVYSGQVDFPYCPYDCDGCHDTDTCPCPNCDRLRGGN